MTKMSLSTKNKVIVFDLDDTLYKEIDFVKSGFHAIASAIGIEGAQDELLNWLQHGENAFEKLTAKYSIGYSISELLQIYRSHIPDIYLDNDTEECLNTLKEKAHLGLITDGRTLTQWNKIQALGLTAFIQQEDILVSEAFGYGKPAPQVYGFFEVKYPDCAYYYIGDNVTKDFVTANERGWTTVCLLDDGRNIHRQDVEVAKEFQPRYRVQKLSQVCSIID